MQCVQQIIRLSVFLLGRILHAIYFKSIERKKWHSLWKCKPSIAEHPIWWMWCLCLMKDSPNTTNFAIFTTPFQKLDWAPTIVRERFTAKKNNKGRNAYWKMKVGGKGGGWNLLFCSYYHGALYSSDNVCNWKLKF